MDRSLAVGATSGSLSALLLRLLSSSLDSPCPAFDCDCDCPACLDLPALIIPEGGPVQPAAGHLSGASCGTTAGLGAPHPAELGGLVALSAQSIG